jgi:type VI secretion system Hcp family effector
MSVRRRAAGVLVLLAALVVALLLGPLRPASAAPPPSRALDAVPGVGQAGERPVYVALAGINDRDPLEATAFETGLSRPLTAGGGQVTGKLQLSPVVFRHAYDRASPRIADAVAKASVLKTVVVTSYSTSGELRLRVTFKDVRVTAIRQYLPDVYAKDAVAARVPLLEEVTLSYRTAEWCAYDDNGKAPLCTAYGA